MSHSRYALTIVLIFLLHPASPAQQAVPALDKNDPELRAILTEIEADAESARLKAKIPGMSIVIVHDQDVLLAKGFGYADLEKKIPADPQTVYRIGSVTKSFTAMMLMQLRDAGKLALVPVRPSNNYFARLGSGGPPIEVSDVTGSIVLNRI